MVPTEAQVQELGIIHVLTDGGAEYCGKLKERDYGLCLDVNGIEHTKAKARHPQTKGIRERFHKTILQEFCQITFQRKPHRSLE